MAFDMSRCPQNEEEAKNWFYDGIGRTLGTAADGWESVMANCGLPPGYGPGTVPNALMPFFAITQQFSGSPKGRLFLPTSIPDENGYYTRCIQYLDDAVGTHSKAAQAAAKGKKPLPQISTASASGLIWSWYYIAGYEYDPVWDETGSAPSPTPGGGLSQEEIQSMIDTSIQQAIANFTGVVYGDKIALRTNSGLLAGILGGGPTAPDQVITLIGKEGDPHAWESFTLEKGE